MWETSRVSESEEKIMSIEEWSAASVLAGIVLTGGHWPLATGESFPGPGPVVTSGHSHTDPQSRTETTLTHVFQYASTHHHITTHARAHLSSWRAWISLACTHAPVTCLTWAGQLRVSFTRWSLTLRQTFVCQVVMPLIFSSLNFWYFYSLSSLFCSSQTHSPAARDPYQYLS